MQSSAHSAFASHVRACVGVGMVALLAACATLPPQQADRPASRSIVTTGTLLARMALAATAAHPGDSGVYPLTTGSEAFLSRLVLADAAESTLDLQYYLWNDDTTGRLLLDHVVVAADRGVRVRLLLDDWGAHPADETLRTLHAHPNVDVRLFNPAARGGLPFLGKLLDLHRLNRRMHNKGFIADNRVAIIGGRNVGDEYFEAGGSFEFADLDVIAVGPVVDELSDEFDAFWNSPSAFPVDALVPDDPGRDAFAALRIRLAATRDENGAQAYLAALAHSTLVHELRDRRLSWLWGQARLLYDDPRKLESEPGEGTGHLAGGLAPVFRSAQSEVLLISPYFVPSRTGVSFLTGLEARGVAVRILTNSLAATDAVAAHAAYARYRDAMLDAGIELYETRATTSRARHRHHDADLYEIATSPQGMLHAKVYGIDRRVVFVGSFNFDPRSRLLNTEMGLLLDIPVLAERLAAGFDAITAEHAWRLERVPAAESRPAHIEWVATEDGRERRLADEPAAEFWRRLRAMLMSLLPLDELL